MLYRLILAVLMALFCATPLPSAAQGVKRALVIGNNNYRFIQRLNTAVNDASALADELKSLGFDVTLGEDVDVQTFNRQLYDFSASLETAQVVLFYFAGHGIQIDGDNYLVPVDANRLKREDFTEKLIPLSNIVTLLTIQRHYTIILLDACRSSPFPDNKRGDFEIANGLAQVNVAFPLPGVSSSGPKSGILIGFATGPGQVAVDGGMHSPFATALLDYLPLRGKTVNSLYNLITKSVASTTRNKQIPWSQSAMMNDLYIAGAPMNEVKPLPPP